MLSDVYVCKREAELTVEQAKLLKLLGKKMSKFTLKILIHRNSKGKIKETEFAESHLDKFKEWFLIKK